MGKVRHPAKPFREELRSLPLMDVQADEKLLFQWDGDRLFHLALPAGSPGSTSASPPTGKAHL